MPRDIPVGNGQMLVTYDAHYQIRDLYFPHVGQENHAGRRPCRFGVWCQTVTPEASQRKPRQRRVYWTDDGWDIDLAYVQDTFATAVRLGHHRAQVEIAATDVVDFHRPLLVREMVVTNQCDERRLIRLFHHNQFHMYGADVGDTAYFDPQTRSVVHYRAQRYLMATWYADGDVRLDQWATGASGFNGAEGTWRDAEDGTLGCNPIAQGAVDSTIMLELDLEAGASQTVHLLIGAGASYADLETLHQFALKQTPRGVIDRTKAYWRLWLNANRGAPVPDAPGRLPERVVELYKRSLLIVRSQIDNSGAILAANDSDYLHYSRDTYSYLWPRDGALVAAAMDAAGFPDVARGFYNLCSELITEHGYFLHKYNPDGSPASSWHPWYANGQAQLPIQEDETALVLWALWRHYILYRDIEFVRPLWVDLITRAADFLTAYRDPRTRLPLPSYDLWEERWGVHAFTVASVWAGLVAAWQFSVAFGDDERARRYGAAAIEVKEAFRRYFWSPDKERYARRLVPRDGQPTSQFVQALLKTGDPLADRRQPRTNRMVSGPADDWAGVPSPGEPGAEPSVQERDELFEVDDTLDASLQGIFAFRMLEPRDAKVELTMRAVAERLWVNTPVGGVARYESDPYHRTSDDSHAVPGNPWIICTLWLADYEIARARSVRELQNALPYLDWVANHALPSGVLAEQVHPLTNAPLSVSPLTWSHASVISTFMGYRQKLDAMQACPACGSSADPGLRPADSLLKHPDQLIARLAQGA